MKALQEIQRDLKAPKNQRNNFGKYNYRSCEDILEAVKPLLHKHNATLIITDEVKQVADLIFVESSVIFRHLEFDSPIIVKAQAGINPNRKGMDIAQSFGSSSSYARKYALNGLFLIDDTKDADTMDNSKEPSKRKLTKEQFDKTKIANKKQIETVLNSQNLELTKEQRTELTKLIK